MRKVRQGAYNRQEIFFSDKNIRWIDTKLHWIVAMNDGIEANIRWIVEKLHWIVANIRWIVAMNDGIEKKPGGIDKKLRWIVAKFDGIVAKGNAICRRRTEISECLQRWRQLLLIAQHIAPLPERHKLLASRYTGRAN